jgi:hypothetical protein
MRFHGKYLKRNVPSHFIEVAHGANVSFKLMGKGTVTEALIIQGLRQHYSQLPI